MWRSPKYKLEPRIIHGQVVMVKVYPTIKEEYGLTRARYRGDGRGANYVARERGQFKYGGK